MELAIGLFEPEASSLVFCCRAPCWKRVDCCPAPEIGICVVSMLT